jgi:hypothetical protein
MKVVGEDRNGIEAIEKIRAIKPRYFTPGCKHAGNECLEKLSKIKQEKFRGK